MAVSSEQWEQQELVFFNGVWNLDTYDYSATVTTDGQDNITRMDDLSKARTGRNPQTGAA